MKENKEKTVTIQLSESELRYLLGAGVGLLLNIPKDSLSTYVSFSKDEILEFTSKIRSIMDDHDISS